jgi:hypothetical protein
MEQLAKYNMSYFLTTEKSSDPEHLQVHIIDMEDPGKVKYFMKYTLLKFILRVTKL